MNACTICGKTHDQPVVTKDELTERDTAGVCKACGKRAVDGLEALMPMGLVCIVSDEEERETMPAKRYRLKLATWIVVREAEEPSPRVVKHPEGAAQLVTEFVKACDDDKEHFWMMFLNQHLGHNLGHQFSNDAIVTKALVFRTGFI
jgi:hypothetical protein